jgi:glycosyltransferase involved in cell wall biosynthesis
VIIVDSVMQQKIFIVEAGPINPYLDAGSRCILDLKNGLSQLGYLVQILKENDVDFEKNLIVNKDCIFILSRPSLAARILLKYPEIKKTIYFGHDLHFKRLKLQNEILDNYSYKNVRAMKIIEVICWQKSKKILYPSKDESEFVNNYLGENKAIDLPIYSFDENPKIVKERQCSLVFVGGEGHEPNRDGLIWFIEKIWPELISNIEIDLKVIGKWSNQIIQNYSDNNINFLGNLEEEDMLNIVMNSGIGIAPLRFGAGVKRKVLQYFHGKIPVVTTDFGVEGLNKKKLNNIGVEIANDEKIFATHIQKLLIDKNRFKNSGLLNYKFLMEEYSNKVYLNNLNKILS